MNLYGFAGGDPVNFSDPMGLCPLPLALAGPAGLVGTASLCIGEAVLLATEALGGAYLLNALADGVFGPGRRFSPKTKDKIDQDATEATGKEGTCEYCGVMTAPKVGKESSKEFDHWESKASGGDNTPGNGRRSCRKCNRKFGSKPKPDPRTMAPPPQPPQTPNPPGLDFHE